MLRDIDFFNSRISRLDGAADIGDYLTKIVEDKTVAENPISSEAGPPTTDSTTEKSQADTKKS